MRTIARPARTARAALVVALVTTVACGTAAAGVTPAGTDSPPVAAAGTPLDLTAGIGDIFFQAEIADDAVYYTVAPRGLMSEALMGLYGRTRTTTAAGTTLGRAELLDRIGIATLVAEQDGTLAYVQASTGLTVLRAPDGTVTEEVWADSPMVAGGVAQLSDSWLVGATNPWEPTYVLIDRSTGTGYDLTGLVTVPAGFHWAHVTNAHVTETQVAWSVYAEGTGASGDTFTGVYTAPLTADGPGAVTVLATATNPDPLAYRSVDLVTLDGGRLAWSAITRTWSGDGTCGTTLSWYDAAPYTGMPSSLPVGCSWVRGVEGGTVVTEGLDVGGGQFVEWRDLAGTGDPTSSLEYLGRLDTVRGTLVVTSDILASSTLIADASGLPVTGDQATPLLPAPFVDQRVTDPFLFDILSLADQGVVGGYPDHTFQPLGAVNRDAMAAFLYRAAGEPAFTPPTTPTFADVPTSHPFFTEIEWLASTGITTGWTVGTRTEFRPSTPVTREAMAAFLYRFAHDGADAPDCASAPFTDVAAGQRFCGEVAWLADAGISQGWPDGTFRPALSIERQAMAAFLVRFLEL